MMFARNNVQGLNAHLIDHISVLCTLVILNCDQSPQPGSVRLRILSNKQFFAVCNRKIATSSWFTGKEYLFFQSPLSVPLFMMKVKNLQTTKMSEGQNKPHKNWTI